MRTACASRYRVTADGSKALFLEWSCANLHPIRELIDLLTRRRLPARVLRKRPWIGVRTKES
jgi:hypothetical protein